MSEKSTNQVIFEWLNPDACWHEYDPNRRAWIPKQGLVFTKYVSNERANICIKCGKDAGMPLQVNDEPLVSTSINVPDYESDLNAIHGVEERIYSTAGLAVEYIALLKNEVRRNYSTVHDWHDWFRVATASASVRAEAIRKLIEG